MKGRVAVAWHFRLLAILSFGSTAAASAAADDLLWLLERRVRIQSAALGPGWHEGLFNRQRREPPCFVVIIWKLRPSPDSPMREASVVPLKDVSRLQAYSGRSLSLQEWAGRPSAEATDESLWQPVSETTLAMNRVCGESGRFTGSDRPDPRSGLETSDPPAGLKFLRTVPELRGVNLTMPEREFQELLRLRGLTAHVDQSAGQTTYWVSTATGENVIVMFRDRVCAGIQRMPPSAVTAGDVWQFVRIALVQDSRPVSRDISAELQLRLIPLAHARVDHFGWTVGVFRQPVMPETRNLLYHSRYFHGPYPTDVLAWITAAKYFPDERVLPVYGYPWEIQIRILDAVTQGLGDEGHFVSGEVEVSWRRLPRSNPVPE